ncbi:hypothetical protein EX30DRAFT_232915 [Ascodesmis nigricans]|uniref:Uncharacterized protein n=1 Tax=Ascodesmis nigricans TaxID=341454 RepID=A0A4S2MYL2_9PEZI|nr:hypothetical protein EX30DRAFT_232915 [Ascodesmis nigricans]
MERDPRHYASRQPCDSYFVESMDQDDHIYDSGYIARMNAETQDEIAEDLSRLVAEEYQDEILEHMELMESETLPEVANIDIQEEIQWYMRAYLLEFIIEAHNAFKLLPETLFLTINLLDRYCSKRVVFKRHYQLVGCAAMLIAAKYGDKKDRVPTVRELKAMCCNLYEEDMFIQMEWHVLSTLNWTIGHPTVEAFLQLILQEAEYPDPKEEQMARYLAEIAMFHKDFVDVRPSVMARTVLVLARHILGTPQPPMSVWASTYNPEVLVILSQFIHAPSDTLKRKYEGPERGCVSHTLSSFMAYQAMLAHRNMPPTPPSEELSSQRMLIDEPANCMTPQKHHAVPTGYMTPPITPNSGYVDNSVPSAVSNTHRVPSTPPHPRHSYYVS